MMTLASLEQRLNTVADELGACGIALDCSSTTSLIEMRLRAGRRLVFDPHSAEANGLDVAGAVRASIVHAELEQEWATTENPGPERGIVELCLFATAGGVTASSLKARFATAMAGCDPSRVTALLELIDRGFAIVEERSAGLEIEATAAPVEEPPVHARTIAELTVIAAARMSRMFAEDASIAAIDFAARATLENELAEKSAMLLEHLGEGQILEARELLDGAVADLERAAALLSLAKTAAAA